MNRTGSVSVLYSGGWMAGIHCQVHLNQGDSVCLSHAYNFTQSWKAV